MTIGQSHVLAIGRQLGVTSPEEMARLIATIAGRGGEFLG